MRRASFVLVITLLAAPGCRSAVEPSGDQGPQPFASTEVFAGTLSMLGTEFLPFNVLQTASTSVTLVSLAASGTATTVSVPLTLGLGSLSGDASACNATNTTTAAPRLTAHIADLLQVASYCVVLSDPGNLTGAVDFAVRITQIAGLEPVPLPGTDTFLSNLYPGGAINRTVSQDETGDLVVRLASVSPAAAIGLGLGVTQDGSHCYLHEALVSAPGATAPISTRADPGLYCVRVFDPGGLPERVVFNVQIEHR
jgi:hypothetical protein